MSEQIYSDMMYFSGSQSEGNQKMTGRRSIAKNTPREKPQGVFDVQYYLVTAHVTDAECGTAVGTAPVVAAAGTAPATRAAC